MLESMTMNLPTLRNQALNGMVLVLFALFLIMLPRYTDTAKTWYVLLLLIGLCYQLFNFKVIADTSIAERWFFGAVAVNFLWTAASFYLNGEPGRGDSILWGRHFYLLFLVPMFFLFRRVRLTDTFLLATMICCVMLSLTDMLIDLARGIDHRLQGMNPNAFGPIQLSLTGMLLLFFLLNTARPHKWLALAGFVGGAGAVVLSQSKSSWMTAVILALLLVLYLSRARPLLVRLGLIVLTAALLASSYLLPMVKERIDYGMDSVGDYYASDDFRDDSRLGSFGTRIELWRTGWNIFLEYPLLGAGVGNFPVLAKQNSERYRVNEIVHRFKYVHNQYIAALATRGIPGLVLFLLVLGMPLYLALRRRTENPGTEFARLSVILICMNYLLGCIWEDHFEGKSAIMFTTIMLPMLLARISPGHRDSRADPEH